MLANLDIADDSALLSEAVQQAQELLHRVETECNKVGLGLNGPQNQMPGLHHRQSSSSCPAISPGHRTRAEERLQVPWILGRGIPEGRLIPEGVSLEIPQQYGGDLEVQHGTWTEEEFLCCHGGVYPHLRLRELGIE